MCEECRKLNENRWMDMGSHLLLCERHRYHSGCYNCEMANWANDINASMKGCGKH